MSASRSPIGMASGKATATIAMEVKKPVSTTGKLVTSSAGSKNRWRNRLEFHAWTQGCSSSHCERDSVVEMPSTEMAGMPSTLASVPSASS